MTWEQLGADHWVYLNANGAIDGSVKRVAVSWECVYLGEAVCWRPDVHSAKRAIEYLAQDCPA